MPTIICFGRTRYWKVVLKHTRQRVVNAAVRRCLGMHLAKMREGHITHEQLCAAAQWEPFEHTIARYSLLWLGHVARIPNHRRSKQALFGWWKGHTKKSGAAFGQAQWLENAFNSVASSDSLSLSLFSSLSLSLSCCCWCCGCCCDYCCCSLSFAAIIFP
jgi:hypothetical protein